MSVGALARSWRDEAGRLRERYADERGAQLFELHAKELEEAITKDQNEVLGLAQAANESGYSADHLGRLLAKGSIPNAGRKNAPRVRRCDLPIRPGHTQPRVARTHPGIPNIGDIGRRAMRSRERRKG